MTRRRALALAAVWILPSAILLGWVAVVYRHWRIDVPPRLSPEARAAVVATLRAALDDRALAPDHPELRRRLPDGGPVVATLWLDGNVVGRVEGYGGTIAEGVQAAAALASQHPLIEQVGAAARARARWKVDVVVGRGPVERDHSIIQLVALHPGVDGLGVAVAQPGDDPTYLLLPDEMFLEGLLAKKPLTNLVPEVGMGVDFKRAETLFAARAQVPMAQWSQQRRRYFRFRTDAFLEAPDGVTPPLALYRGLPPGPPVNPATLRAAALAGARYLVNHLGSDGRYIYEQNLTNGRASPGYSLPRHAGTTYFLAEVYRHTKAPWLLEPVERAAGLLGRLVEDGGCKRTLPDGRAIACVIDRGERTGNLGSTALGVVALAEYQRATDDRRFLPLATTLAEWILWMQRSDGSFRHLYDVKSGVADDKTMLLYFSGEAALALARMYAITGDERYAQASERALDWLVAWYDFFVGGFLYGEEHWTCIASEALIPYKQKARYRDFCNGLARFWGQSQARPGDYPDQPDLVGSHNLTPFVMPQNTPAGSHTEARISTYLLGKAAGHPSAALRHDILETLGYLLAQQLGPHNDYPVIPAARGFGGISTNPVDRTVRIDYVQHVCSAMIRGAELAEEAGARP
ncbi:MAG: hypothetical protein IPL61_16105 [Myxococcales bacterium]|nr:hypothetical protein [Myxococcales bacterium]